MHSDAGRLSLYAGCADFEELAGFSSPSPRKSSQERPSFSAAGIPTKPAAGVDFGGQIRSGLQCQPELLRVSERPPGRTSANGLLFSLSATTMDLCRSRTMTRNRKCGPRYRFSPLPPRASVSTHRVFAPQDVGWVER